MNYRNGMQAFMGGAYGVLPFTTGVIPFGLVAGVTAIEMGLSPGTFMGMTLLFYSGSAQMVVMQLMTSGALPWTMVLTALVINMRYLMYSAALAPHLHGLPRRTSWPLTFLISDQAFALFSLRLASGESRAFGLHYYAGAAVTLWLGWNLSVAVGLIVGARMPADWPLSFAIPLSFLALLIPSIRNAPMLWAAIVGGGLAVLGAGLPYNLGMLIASLGGIAAGLLAEHLHRPSATPQLDTLKQDAS